jgi:hypothetical protein
MDLGKQETGYDMGWAELAQKWVKFHALVNPIDPRRLRLP